MKYLVSFKENKIAIGSKPQPEKITLSEDLEKIFFEMIFDNIVGGYGNNLEQLVEDINFQESLEDWINFIHKNTSDECKEHLGKYFTTNYIYKKGERKEKRRLYEYIKEKLIEYVGNN
ncbi:hypothetical protein [Marinirhabdus gelatinilytica]|uniref:Uncharacterized protein n=1 Tax=Marinirhabdus gelatinilytica TaxID=1703343 RepID=A0A370QG14_9FLAO|nr:hypothetical protein [Marinirhabdus gelatinilytica]RDK86980.1 hypothetical protein C8D94_102158 [Marinirhabdus gelatinilytica]